VVVVVGAGVAIESGVGVGVGAGVAVGVGVEFGVEPTVMLRVASLDTINPDSVKVGKGVHSPW
jgi:hypothetical protein